MGRVRPWGSLLLPGQAASGGLGDARPGAGGPRCTLRGPGVPRPPPRLQPRRRAWRVPRSGRLWDPHGSGGMTGLGAAPGGQAGDRVSRAGVSVPHQPLLRVLGLRPERRPVAIPGTAGPGGGGRVCTCGACGWQVWRARGGGHRHRPRAARPWPAGPLRVGEGGRISLPGLRTLAFLRHRRDRGAGGALAQQEGIGERSENPTRQRTCCDVLWHRMFRKIALVLVPIYRWGK